MSENTFSPVPVHYFIVDFEIEGKPAQSAGLKFSAPADYAGLYSMPLVAFAQQTLAPEMKVINKSYASFEYPRADVSYLSVEVIMNELGQPVVQSLTEPRA